MRRPERRNTRRFIMRVALKFRSLTSASAAERSAEAMNISNGGVYFATDLNLPEGSLVELHLQMPREILGDDVPEWRFMGRVAHVESFHSGRCFTGVGVQFLYYEVPKSELGLAVSADSQT